MKVEHVIVNSGSKESMKKYNWSIEVDGSDDLCIKCNDELILCAFPDNRFRAFLDRLERAGMVNAETTE